MGCQSSSVDLTCYSSKVRRVSDLLLKEKEELAMKFTESQT